MFVLFISHQWLGSAHPDPQGAQLSVLRIALQRMVDGLLAVEEDLKLAPVTRVGGVGGRRGSWWLMVDVWRSFLWGKCLSLCLFFALGIR